MVAKKKSRGGTVGEDAGEGLSRAPLQAILLADSFSTLFRPITLERPKVLLPLVNAPMIEYTLAWLESAGVKEVFVFCCAHSKQVIEYLENSDWLNQPNFSVSTIKHAATSAGHALRLIYDKDVIRGDFVLVTGNTVSDMPLTEALKEHKERKKRDSNVVMTMVIKQSKPSPVTDQSRLGTEELFMAIDPETKELLYYGTSKADTTLALDRTVLLDRSSISPHNDMQDCYIDICSPVVLSLFADNFDYQHLRLPFVQDLLVDDLMGYKIFTHEMHHSSYAARVDNYRSYDTISKEIIQRWTYPLVPKLIGSGTTIGKHSQVSNSVIGENCVIGSNVSVDGCYIWNNVNIEDGCRLKQAIVCDGVTIKSGAVLEAGAVISFNVIIGQNFVVPAYSNVSLLQQPVSQGSYDEMEELVSDLRIQEAGGAGYIWPVGEGEWRHSMAPISSDRLVEIIKSATDELDILDSGNESDDGEDDYAYFEKEVEATFLRAVHENVEQDHIIVEVDSLRFANNLASTDCAGALFYAMMKYAVDTSAGEALFKITHGVIEKWEKLFKWYLLSLDEEIEVILKFEEMCLESTKEYASLFPKILRLLYEKGILQEDAILRWESEKEHADESDKVFVKKAEKFLQGLEKKKIGGR
ncbi:translation initiation factor eIF-2B subunit epsilon isoform X2 [Salvia divinorum]|uniref:Translation initiation factor eIF2B subunit epsilon n=1 Tax=Salvia divinorum TaxID=28513 RepID=A0ABD1GH77_SALDI